MGSVKGDKWSLNGLGCIFLGYISLACVALRWLRCGRLGGVVGDILGGN